MNASVANRTPAKAKIEWLLKNKSKWEPFRGIKDNKQLYPLAKEMLKEGLYSEKTFVGDIATSIRKFIATH